MLFEWNATPTTTTPLQKHPSISCNDPSPPPSGLNPHTPSPIEIFRFPIQYRRFYQKQQQRRKKKKKKNYNIIFSHSCPASRKHTDTHTHTLIRNRVLPAIYNITHTYIICLHILFCFNFFPIFFGDCVLDVAIFRNHIYLQVLYEYW